MSEPAHWLGAVAELFGVSVTELTVLDSVWKDVSSWFISVEFEGTRVVRFPSPSPERVTLYFSRAPAGSELPLHGHDGVESVLVLQGGYRELGANDRHVGAGEIARTLPGQSHKIIIDPGIDCICAIRVDFEALPKTHRLDTGIRKPPASGAE